MTSTLSAKLLLGMLLLAGLSSISAQTSGCTLNKRVYICGPAPFQRALRHAKTIAIEVKPRDRMAREQAQGLVEALGKTAEPAGSEADLTFLLIPVDPDGIVIGPADRELATLRVYGPGADGQHGPLLWAETFSGQPGMPWPSVVHALIMQFQGRFGRN